MQASGKKRQRTCVSCGRQDDKVALYRIVRSPEGQVIFDVSGRAAGRGAYVCSAECFQSAAKTKKLERALKIKLEPIEYEKIERDLAQACSQAQGLAEE